MLVACSSQIYTPVDSINNIPVLKLKEGRQLYVQNCASCHQLYTPRQYSAAAWARNLAEMQERSHISDREKDLIYDYLVNAPK